MSRDPVCKMEINESEAKISAEYNGKKYFFCAEQCKLEFQKNPAGYVSKKSFISRFINWLGSGSNGKPRSCH